MLPNAPSQPAIEREMYVVIPYRFLKGASAPVGEAGVGAPLAPPVKLRAEAMARRANLAL